VKGTIVIGLQINFNKFDTKSKINDFKGNKKVLVGE